MITTIATVNVFVEDQDRAKAIYTEPQVQDWGSIAMLVDSEGNQIVLGQRD